ncbi:MAG: hypothetical protein KY476_19275 [Planctomycetes bacterium]|nr:hypothetical protein [Planctomycetota bacterium]
MARPGSPFDRPRRLMVALGLLLMCGCGGRDPDRPATAPVTGTVTYNGKPLTEGTVTFVPQAKGNPATGQIGPNGRFTLTTYETNDGAVVGFHVVTVQVFAEGALPGMEAETSDAPSIPAKYEDPATSDLLVEVKGEPNNIPLELKD